VTVALAKAQLLALTGGKDPTPVQGAKPVVVQFNPASLRLQLTNDTAGGRTQGHPAEQHLGEGSTQLSFDLHFDTADTGENVRKQVELVEQFVKASAPGSKKAPPRVQFSWGEFLAEGVMTGLQEEIDLFSPRGVPLRSKVGVTIKLQDPKRVASAGGAGAAQGTSQVPGAQNAPPGTTGAGAPGDRAGTALGGESAAAFAARMGIDPSAWRGLGAGLDSPLSLAAGLEIDFSSALSGAAGLGSQSGVQAGGGASIEQAFGLDPPGGRSGPAAAGFALAAAGGVRAAVESVQIAKTEQAASQAVQAFAAPTAALPATSALKPAAPEQARPPLAAAGLPAGPAAPAPSAPAPPRADPRADSFGFGVPLRPRVGGAAAERQGPYGGWIVVGTRSPRLPAPLATTAAARRRPKPCGCGCGCEGGCS
jgi:hypothetical protein